MFVFSLRLYPKGYNIGINNPMTPSYIWSFGFQVFAVLEFWVLDARFAQVPSSTFQVPKWIPAHLAPYAGVRDDDERKTPFHRFPVS